MTELNNHDVLPVQEAPKKSSVWWIILVVFLVVFFCCCALILIFYFWLGDLILQIFNDIIFQLGSSYY